MVHSELDAEIRYPKGMTREINLLVNYPRTARDIPLREKEKTLEVREIARKFGKDFFDGERKYGYGGFNYDPKYWTQVVKDMRIHYDLPEYASILDVGCAKGFMIYDFQNEMPRARFKGVDISQYAIEMCKPEVADSLLVADAQDLPFEDDSFDLVISINTVHNLDLAGCKRALREIERVSRKNSFITVDAFRNAEERVRMESWNLTAKTILSVEEWKTLFESVGYTGDYYWFIP